MEGRGGVCKVTIQVLLLGPGMFWRSNSILRPPVPPASWEETGELMSKGVN